MSPPAATDADEGAVDVVVRWGGGAVGGAEHAAMPSATTRTAASGVPVRRARRPIVLLVMARGALYRQRTGAAHRRSLADDGHPVLVAGSRQLLVSGRARRRRRARQ